MKKFRPHLKNLEKTLTDKDIKKRELAEALNMKPQELSKIIHGQTEPGIVKCYKISKVLRRSVDYLFKEWSEKE